MLRVSGSILLYRERTVTEASQYENPENDHQKFQKTILPYKEWVKFANWRVKRAEDVTFMSSMARVKVRDVFGKTLR